MDRLAAMATFVRVVESGSFSAVAREQNGTQSAVSKQVAGLERVLGVKLLARTTRSLALTDAGERYFEQARRLVAEVLEAESGLRRGKEQLAGWLRIAASVGFGRRVLLPMVQSFLDAHPAVRVDLKLNDGFIDLVEQGIDIAVRVGELADSTLVARRIGTTRRAVVASRRYLRKLPKGLRAPRAPADLLAHNCIVYTEVQARIEWVFTAAAGTQSVRVGGNLQTNSSEVIRAAILAGMGIGYAPTWLFDEEIASGEVQPLMPGWRTQPLPMHLVSPPHRRHAAKVQAFSDHVAATLARA
ncbi:MAG TPA: LysR family transcriptional regulator [Usitatibacter sp.]|nr:LysR family transcriptional regulator [Usitatibacter sp.]